MHAPVGVYGKLARSEQALKPGDRVEIYRALPTDPKAARRARAKQARRRALASTASMIARSASKSCRF